MKSALANESRLFTGVCPLGWTYQLSGCFFYNVGASTYRQAATFCQRERAVLLPTLMVGDLQPLINNFITYEDLDGTEKRSVMWLSNGKKNTRSCPVYPANVKDKRSTDIGITNCNELHPFICKQTSVVRCKNSCFNKGSCVGTTCVCFRFVTVSRFIPVMQNIDGVRFVFKVAVHVYLNIFVQINSQDTRKDTHSNMYTHSHHKHIYRYIHAYIHTHTHHANTYINTNTHTQYIYIHTHKHIHIHVFI
jgi:hypothetical protein